MRAHDQSSIFSTGGKFRPDYGFLLELHALTLVTPFLCALGNMQLPAMKMKMRSDSETKSNKQEQ